jgi:plastocyanin
MDRRAYLATAAGTGLGLVAGCLGLGSSSGDYDVGMTSAAYDPPQVTVSAGDTVVWKNTSSRAHTVTAYQGSYPDGAEYWATGGYESQDAAVEAWPPGGGLDGSETYEHTFEIPGTYEYYCIPHEASGMLGTVVVEEGTSVSTGTQ